MRGGKVIPLKLTVDDALLKCPSVEKVFVVKRTGKGKPYIYAMMLVEWIVETVSCVTLHYTLFSLILFDPSIMISYAYYRSLPIPTRYWYARSYGNAFTLIYKYCLSYWLSYSCLMICYNNCRINKDPSAPLNLWIGINLYWINIIIGMTYYFHSCIFDYVSKQIFSPSSEDSMFFLYTSGSTGKPKGMVHTTGGISLRI